MDAISKPKRKIKKEKASNKRWTEDELKSIVDYLLDHRELEKPTAQIFYKKLIATTGIDASWEIVRWKVKHLKTNYNKAEAWRKSTGAGLLEADKGIYGVQAKLNTMCRFYCELHIIFAPKTSEFAFDTYDTCTTSNLGVFSTQMCDPLSNDVDICVTDGIDEMCETSFIVLESDAESSKEHLISSIPESQGTVLESVGADKGNATAVKNKSVQEFAAKLKKSAPKNAADQLSAIQSERNTFLKMKIDFEKEKFSKEFELNERTFFEKVETRREQMELKRLEIEKDERLRKLELEKQERIERYEIEMKYKYAKQ